MKIWLVILVGGLLTYAIRLSFILLFGRLEIPPRLRQALSYVPVSVLTAIILPELLLQDGALDFSTGNPRLIAGLLAGLIAWRTRSAVLTIGVGMLVLLLLQAWMS